MKALTVSIRAPAQGRDDKANVAHDRRHCIKTAQGYVDFRTAILPCKFVNN
jgi:hypothetical protein